MRQIVVPELKRFYKRLQENASEPGFLERECKLSGVPLTASDKIERLVSIQEYRIRKLLKSKLFDSIGDQFGDDIKQKYIKMT